MDQPLLIIGAGLAGWQTVREFRKLDTTTPVTLVTADAGDFYAKPTLSNAFGQKRGPAQLVTTPAATIAQTLNVTLLSHTQVTAIDTATQTVHTSTGPLGYRDLVLATGAQPIRVPLSGAAVTVSTAALPPVAAAGSKPVVRTVITLVASRLCTMAIALPA